jgi:hypothetical protein
MKVLEHKAPFLVTMGWEPVRTPPTQRVFVLGHKGDKYTYLNHHAMSVFLPNWNMTLVSSPLLEWSSLQKAEMFRAIRVAGMNGSLVTLLTKRDPTEDDKVLFGGFPVRLWIHDSDRPVVHHSWIDERPFPTLLCTNPGTEPGVFMEISTCDPQEVESHMMYETGMDDPSL